eukprot:g67968.t1
MFHVLEIVSVDDLSDRDFHLSKKDDTFWCANYRLSLAWRVQSLFYVTGPGNEKYQVKKKGYWSNMLSTLSLVVRTLTQSFNRSYTFLVSWH